MIDDEPFFVCTVDQFLVNYRSSDIMMFERLDYDNEKYDYQGWIDVDDDERITDEQLIEWLKEKRDD